ncbi:MAG: ABC transporter permease [Candidatus Competibacteraceae bacterium]|jgi:ABC-2 type transport system permease protein|nr:ABC transporter permease [Candidatus Competibacteraceae bacterium]
MRLSAHWIAFQTILIKEILRFLRIWVQTILPPAITMSLYFIIFGKLIGSQIGGVNGFTYMQYIVPGLIMMAIITNAYSNVVSSFYSAKFQRHIEEMLVSPLPNHLIVMGFVGGGLARGLIVGVAVTAVSLCFTQLHIHNILVVFAVTGLTAVLFALGGLVNGIYANSFDDISIVPTFVLTPLTYLGGVFYSIDMLPEFWQTVSLLNPILYMVNAFRYGILGTSDIDIYAAFAIILLLITGLFIFSLWLLERGVGIRQ